MDYTDFLEFEMKLELEKAKIPKVYMEIEDEEVSINTLLNEGKSFHEINEIYKEGPKYKIKIC